MCFISCVPNKNTNDAPVASKNLLPGVSYVPNTITQDVALNSKKDLQAPKSILMIRPRNPGFNIEASKSNMFMKGISKEVGKVSDLVRREFDEMVKLLRSNNVIVNVVDDTEEPVKPDAVFPDWISTFPDGNIAIYSMQCPNRRLEIRRDVVAKFKKPWAKVIDLSKNINKNEYLEGSGSIMYDHYRKIGYACRSPRTTEALFKRFMHQIGYKAMMFSARDRNGVAIYHTDVILCVGSDWNIVAADYLEEGDEKEALLRSLHSDGQTSFVLTPESVSNFSGNCVEVQAQEGGKNVLVISETGWKNMPEDAKKFLELKLVVCPAKLDTIQAVGGGSARCMVCSIYC